MAQQLFKTFDEVQTAIKNEKENPDGTQHPGLEDHRFITEFKAERILFEQSYFAVDATARQIIERHAQQAILDRELVAVEAAPRRIDVKLPVLKIPDFDGSFDKWMLFKDAFESIIHNNPNLTDIQKFQYLRSALTGEAVEVIVGMITTVENYQRAWNLLKQNYDNKKLMIHTHVNQLFDLPAVTRNKPILLRQFIVHIRKNLKALEALRIPPEQLADIILIHLAERKLDFMTQRDWEQELGQNTERIPRMEELLEFLSHKCSILEMEYKSEPEPSKSTDGKRYEKRVVLSSKTQDACRNCSEKKLSPTDKMKDLNNWPLCVNCLKLGHYVEECKLQNLSNNAALSMDDIVNHINSSDETLQLLAIQTCRKLLYREQNPPINDMIESDIVPRCINLLDSDHNIPLQIEVAWILAKITSGSFEQTQNVVKHGAVPKLVKLLKSASPIVAEQAVWALGNITLNEPYVRDLVLGHDGLPLLIELIKPDTSILFMRTIVWTLSNLCQGEDPPFELFSSVLPVFNRLLTNYSDPDILVDTCWALSYLTYGSTAKIQEVLQTGILPKLVELLTSKKEIILAPALHTVGNMVRSGDAQTDAVIFAGGLSHLGALLRYDCAHIVEEAAWTISNIMAGNTDQIQSVINAGLLLPLIEVLQFGNYEAQKDAAQAITNLTTKGTIQHLTQLVEVGVLPPFCNLLKAKDWKVIIVVLNGLTNILRAAEKIGQVERFAIMIKEAGGLDKIEALQHHQTEQVHEKSMAIIDAFFSQMDVEEEALTSVVREKTE